jgi:hypothetical protein
MVAGSAVMVTEGAAMACDKGSGPRIISKTIASQVRGRPLVLMAESSVWL